MLVLSVHPRGRGEQSSGTCQSQSVSGSSPRTRGTEHMGHSAAVVLRFIPADAGNRPQHPPPKPRRPVHPRGRGEQAAEVKKKQLESGSSPRTRGTAHINHGSHIPIRFIPADAGNRGARQRSSTKRSVHPRGRGEQPSASVAITSIFGSSPRTRGTGHHQCTQARSLRFIPADAGNSSEAPISSASCSVHPRGRGEQHQSHRLLPELNGSSPRTRGTGPSQVQQADGCRFIPADAGNRPPPAAGAATAPVHPRGRGEQIQR